MFYIFLANIIRVIWINIAARIFKCSSKNIYVTTNSWVQPKLMASNGVSPKPSFLLGDMNRPAIFIKIVQNFINFTKIF